MKKVLIVYATGGMGHVKAAQAVEQAWREKYPAVEVKNVNIIDFANPLYKKVFVDGYNYISSKKPEIWGFLYRQFNNKENQKLPSYLSRLAISRRFIPFIRKFQPDFIIATHPLPMILVSYSKAKDVIDITSSMVVTDFGCHSFWVDPEVNYYFCATQDVARCLGGYGVKLGQMAVTGIPIEPKFAQNFDKKILQQKFGLNPNLFTLLIVGGQFNFSVLKTIISGVKKKNGDKIQFLVVAGRDVDLKESLDNSDFSKNHQVKIFGFIDNMHELMAVSDLIFSKAGGLTVSECLALGLPMIINKVIPGQEEDNVNFLVRKGAGIKVNNFSEIVKSVNQLIINPTKIQKMKKAAKSLGRPKSAEALADFVYKRISKPRTKLVN
ncbi:MAG: hypothetical protein A2729_04365 [Candidatus Buchananbacteria bacterium RIFCSPHIGHO2_01_FULL_39_14]|uniref:UDP-N-acetylglucosamine--LPS N-acetylglucosamine transferase n=2 Tax=Candidatus Buchananiibacteriota TaxID=1817903 RepID=A0A1G1YS83_9BACT|nr:MAG: hypothetical protein A2729_04365 [Candidatus Buchananbacteria bacterium RIFCSPHIGHO2_01_FULL_39_14]OGY49656.1 MAG: hypothetical protein A3D39_00850 [Candidatus Buchananbacteria bacterium RIFCSPHIGHO2_02_FULL_39_17]OGY54287.1 MAG: hypothetical protein A2912_04590 [Candidatus Buchananbacteria bacterium RIFCSPLOWO2_01_FULL_40_23b]